MWYKKEAAQVTPAERGDVKAMAYGLLYGLGIDRLAGSLSTATNTVSQQARVRGGRGLGAPAPPHHAPPHHAPIASPTRAYCCAAQLSLPSCSCTINY